MRPALSVEEVFDLIRSMPDADTIWVENVNERKELYKKILLGNDSSALMRLIKTLYLHGQELKNAGKGKKMHVSDERFLKDAENVLYDEFSYVLDIERDEVLPFINKQIEINTKKAGMDYEMCNNA
jgi:CarD family transcriptional regulator